MHEEFLEHRFQVYVNSLVVMPAKAGWTIIGKAKHKPGSQLVKIDTTAPWMVRRWYFVYFRVKAAAVER